MGQTGTAQYPTSTWLEVPSWPQVDWPTNKEYKKASSHSLLCQRLISRIPLHLGRERVFCNRRIRCRCLRILSSSLNFPYRPGDKFERSLGRSETPSCELGASTARATNQTHCHQPQQIPAPHHAKRDGGCHPGYTAAINFTARPCSTSAQL